MPSSASRQRDGLISLAAFGQETLTFVGAHEAWAAPICFALAFGESLAFVSLLLPATVVLLGVGALAGHAGFSVLPLLAAAALGAALGDWFSYWIGRTFADRIVTMWPLSRRPDLLVRARRLVERWGALGVFAGRFLGPLRASVPLVAGLCAMPRLPFQLANWTSACLWAVLVLSPGALGLSMLEGWFG